jgi:AcrR family transcriptional regulator
MVRAPMPKSQRSNPDPNAAEESTTRRLILKAAATIFLANGYERTSMELVATQSGAGRRTVYNHFRSKKALFDATVAFLWEGMPLDRIISRRENPSRPEQALVEIGYAIAEFWAPEEAVAFMRMIISEGPRFPELVQSFITFGRGPARLAVADFLRSLNKTKAFDIRDPDHAAIQFISLINGPLLWTRMIGGVQPPTNKQRKYVVDEAVETFLSRYEVHRQN